MTCREKRHFLYRYPLFTPYPSRFSGITSTGRPFFALPVEKKAEKLYRSLTNDWTGLRRSPTRCSFPF